MLGTTNNNFLVGLETMPILQVRQVHELLSEICFSAYPCDTYKDWENDTCLAANGSSNYDGMNSRSNRVFLPPCNCNREQRIVFKVIIAKTISAYLIDYGVL